jgi:ketosteroid isomerase-like protein
MIRLSKKLCSPSARTSDARRAAARRVPLRWLCLGLSASALGLSLGFGAAPAGASDADARALAAAEQTWVRALTGAHPALLDGLVDAEFTFIGPDGELEERDAYLTGYRQLFESGVKVLGIDVSDVKTRVLGDTGIVTGRVLAKVEVGGQPIEENVRFTRVYQRRGSSFRMVAGQGTRIAPAAR